MKTDEEIKKLIEEKYLKLRGWKTWKEYDEVRESTELEINTREELIETTLKIQREEILKEIPKSWLIHPEKELVKESEKEKEGK